MSKDKHEALRRDIEDYKVLLIKYQSLRIEQDVLVGDLSREAKLLDSKNEALMKALSRIAYLESELNTVRDQIDKFGVKYTDLDKSYRNIERLYYKERAKNYKMKKGQSEVWIWKGLAIFFFIAMLVVGSHN